MLFRSTRGLKCKLRMMGIECKGFAYAYGGSQPVLASTTAPQSQLKKKAGSISFHYAREGCACDEWRTFYVRPENNAPGILAKPIPAGAKRKKLVGMVLHHI